MIKDLMESLPSYEEVKARFTLIEDTFDDDLVTVGANDQYEWAKVEDGAGNESILVIYPERDEILMFGYDHESALNFYDNNPEQQTVFSGIPEQFKPVIESEHFVWSWLGEDEPKMVFATVGFWFADGDWHVSSEYEKMFDDLNEDELNSARFALKPFLVDEETYRNKWTNA